MIPLHPVSGRLLGVLGLCVLFLWGGIASDRVDAAETVVAVAGTGPAVPMGPFLSILRDPGGRITVEELIRDGAGDRFVPNRQPVPAFGYASDVFWLRLRLRSDAAEPIRPILEMQTPRIGDLTWSVVRGGRVAETESVGMFRVDTPRRIDSRLPALGVGLAPGEEVTVLIRASTPASVSFPLVLHPGFESYTATVLRREFLVALVTGIALCVFLLSLLLGPLLGNRLFLVNAAVVSVNFAQLAIFLGYWTWFRLPLASWVVLQPMLSVGYLGLVMVHLFTWKALGPEFQRSRPGRLQRGLVFLLAALAFMVPFLPFPVVVRWNNFWAPFSLVFCLAMTVWWHRLHRQRWLRLLVLTWSIDVVLDLILILQWEGRIPIVIPPMQLLLAMNALPPLLFLAVGADSVRQWMQDAAKAERLESLLMETRLRMLRYQVNPHFLFNCLNSVVSLIQQDSARASTFVLRLARFLRISLRTEPSGRVPLSEELEAAQAFLDIEQVRFGNHLAPTFEIAPDTRSARVPELILQALVENAVRHGTRSEGKPLEVRIRSQRSGDRLWIEVLNQGRLRAASDSTRATTVEVGAGAAGHGIGISNLQERLALLTPGEARFELVEVAEGDGWVRASLELPWDPAIAPEGAATTGGSPETGGEGRNR